MGCGWSEMVNFMAVTTVVLMSADCDVREAFNLGSRAAGDIRQSLPRHSATTFLVPSSVHSVCLSKFQLCQEKVCKIHLPLNCNVIGLSTCKAGPICLGHKKRGSGSRLDLTTAR